MNEIIKHEDYAEMIVVRKSKNISVLLDLEDVEKVLSVGSWHAIEDKTLKETNYYICHRYNNKKQGKGCIKLHRLLMNCPANMIIDHINHNTCDNRKHNLRICTRFENQQNLRSNKSGIIGVYKRNRPNHKYEYWVGKISKDGITYKKEFKTKEQAIEYRNKMYKELYGGDD